MLFLQRLWGWGRRDSRNPWWSQHMRVISCQPGNGHQGTAGLALDLAAPQAALSLLPSPLGPWLSEATLRGGVLWPYTPQSPWPVLLPSPATAPAGPFSLRRTTTEARFSPCHIALDPQSGFQYSVPSSDTSVPLGQSQGLAWGYRKAHGNTVPSSWPSLSPSASVRQPARHRHNPSPPRSLPLKAQTRIKPRNQPLAQGKQPRVSGTGSMLVLPHHSPMGWAAVGHTWS